MTCISIQKDKFFIDDEPTYAGCTYRGWPIEGLLLNSRMVQATFEDMCAETRHRWAFPDTGVYDAERNVNEFAAALPVYRTHGLLAITVNLQGGSPEGYSKEQPWINTAFYADGSFKANYLDRMRRVIEALNEQGMVAILGIFYFGQDERLQDETAVIQAVDNTIRWILEQGYENVLVEVNNETNVPKYEHEILQAHRIHELIKRAKSIELDGKRLLVGTSYGGGKVSEERVVRVSDFILMHGNGVSDPNRIIEMVNQVRQVPGYRPMPILFNEDDHFDFDKPMNNMLAALSKYASWGYFDPGKNNYHDGFQSPPVQWQPNTARKKAFLALAKDVTGS